MTSRAPGSGEWSEHDHQACLHAKEEAAVALLARREPSAEVLAHLEACPPCKDEYVELAVLPGLLGAARETLVATPPERPPSQLLDRLIGEVGRLRRRRRLTVGMLAAAATAAVVIAVVTLSSVGRTASDEGSVASGTGGPTATLVSTAAAPLVASGTGSDPMSGANARVDVRAEGIGSAVSVAVHGWPRGKPCRMIVHHSGGHAREVGIWTVDTLNAGTYVEEVDLPPASIERVELIDDATGRAMIDVPVRRV